MEDKVSHVSDDSKVAIPLRNLISILGAVAVSTWAYSGVIERLNKIETRQSIDESEIKLNTEFRIGWPRGSMGALPADAKQDMNIEGIKRELESLREDVESNEDWIKGFEPPPEVKNALVKLRELEIKVSVMERALDK